MVFAMLSSLRCCLYDSVLHRTLEILDSGKEDIGWRLYRHGILAIVKKIIFSRGTAWLSYSFANTSMIRKYPTITCLVIDYMKDNCTVYMLWLLYLNGSAKF